MSVKDKLKHGLDGDQDEKLSARPDFFGERQLYFITIKLIVSFGPPQFSMVALYCGWLVPR